MMSGLDESGAVHTVLPGEAFGGHVPSGGSEMYWFEQESVKRSIQGVCQVEVERGRVKARLRDNQTGHLSAEIRPRRHRQVESGWSKYRLVRAGQCQNLV